MKNASYNSTRNFNESWKVNDFERMKSVVRYFSLNYMLVGAT